MRANLWAVVLQLVVAQNPSPPPSPPPPSPPPPSPPECITGACLAGPDLFPHWIAHNDSGTAASHAACHTYCLGMESVGGYQFNERQFNSTGERWCGCFNYTAFDEHATLAEMVSAHRVHFTDQCDVCEMPYPSPPVPPAAPPLPPASPTFTALVAGTNVRCYPSSSVSLGSAADAVHCGRLCHLANGCTHFSYSGGACLSCNLTTSEQTYGSSIYFVATPRPPPPAMPPLAPGWSLVAHDTFPGATGWRSNQRPLPVTACGAFGVMLGGYNAFGRDAFAEKDFDAPQPHSLVRIGFTFYKIDSWDDERARLHVNDDLVWEEAYIHHEGEDVCGRPGAPHWKDLRVDKELTLHSTATRLTLRFTTTINSGSRDES